MKKLLSLVLALMMVFPVFAAAESEVGLIGGNAAPTQILVVNEELPRFRYQNALDAGRRVNQTITLTELTGVQTGDAATDAAIADLVKALGINIATQGDEASLALTISGKDVITLGGALSGEDFYLSSNMLGGTVVLGADEVEPLFNRLLDLLVGMELVAAEQADMLREEIAVLIETLAAEIDQNVEMPEMNFSALETLFDKAVGKIAHVDNIVVPRMCDPAVSGVQLMVDEDDIAAGMKLILQFLLNNPMLLEGVAQFTGLPTEAQLEAVWAANGQLYTTLGFYDSKEAFLADQETVEGTLHEAMNTLGDAKLLSGDATLAVYLDAQDQPVYITGTMPLIAEDEQSEPQTTVTISMNYTRQTVPQGVTHVCNIFAGETGLTIDALVSESSTTVTVTAVEPEFEPTKLFDLSIKETASETNPSVTCMDVVAALYDGADVPVLEVVYDGEYENSDVREYCAGKLTLTAYEFVYADADEAWHAMPNTIIIEFSTDTAITGIDYTTNASFAVEAGGVRFGMQMTEVTADPQPSIMAGNVVRPAELTDTDFSNWFNGVMEAFTLWMIEAVQALPESVLMLLVYAGMM